MSEQSENKVEIKSKSGILGEIKEKLQKGMDKLYAILAKKKRLLVFLACWSAILNFFLEASLRKNLILGFVHIVTQPVTYLYNVLILFCIFTVILFLKRRLFGFCVISVVWLALAITNYVVLLSRNTPLNAPDFRIIKSAFGVVKIYLNIFEQILVIALIIIGISLLVAAFVKGKRSPRNLYFSGCVFAVTAFVTLVITLVVSSNVTAAHFSDLPTAYKKYGFAYSFLCSVVDRGIDKPDDYSDEAVQTLSDNIGLDEDLSESNSSIVNEGATPTTPNIVFLQLESFYDPTNIENLSFNKDPIPIFRSLKNDYMSGKLTVPSIGAGTANTEFEVITGMDIDYFGVAEYPYLSVLQENTCESIAYNLREYGYAAHAMHNHTGSFYDRHIVFQNLGFDTFTSIENMNPIIRNERGWAKDAMLTNEIYNVISSTEDTADVVYAISVQGHGKYPVTKEEFDLIYSDLNPAHIKVEGNENDPQKYGVDYWINQIHDVDVFIGSLINKFKNFEEPTVIVMYGDHLPAFDLDTWKLKEGNLYQTDYVIWSNFDIEKKPDIDLHSFELSSYVMSMFGFDNGYVNKLHQEYFGSEVDYSDKLHLLQYDVLYGEKMIFEGSGGYVSTNIRFGYEPMHIDDVNFIGNTMFVYGGDFNEYSVIYVNGSKKHTSFINENCVSAGNMHLRDGDIVKVVSVTTDFVQVGESNPFIFE